MLRRVQLALALILLLVLAPLAGATCGIACLAATPHHAAAGQHHCVRAATCCHPSAPALCSAPQAPDALAALLSTETNVSQDSSAAAVIAVEAPSLSRPGPAARSADSSPPGHSLAATPIPLRV